MKDFVADLVNNQEVVSYFVISDPPQVRKSKRDTDYWTFKLSDKTGEIEARCWEPPLGISPNALQRCIVKVGGLVTSWDGKLQLSVTKIRGIVPDDLVELGDFFERSERHPDEMWEELNARLFGPSGFTDEDMAGLVRNILKRYGDELKQSPAAKSVHHCFIGGLLEHILSLCNATELICRNYPQLDRNLIYAACVTHDLGKVRELSSNFGIAYSTEGTLLGHITIGLQMVVEEMKLIIDFPPRSKMALLHIIVSHHGRLDWGSPKVPLMREAQAFHLLDMIDSRIAICDRAIKRGINEEGMTEWNKVLEGPVWVHNPEEVRRGDSTATA